MEYESVIGLEVHVHVKTATKAFCGCSTQFGNQANSQVCPVCLGFPGTLPVLNSKFLDSAIKVGLALNCTIQEFTKFDRKNYFYPDLPKNYQISQYDLPLALHGFIEINTNAASKRINILRVHMEEDAGKLMHKDELSLVDFNRTGMPLLEIVSEPDLHSPQEAYDYLTILKSIIQYLDVSDCDMEKGSLRCDANISLRQIGEQRLGTKAELKNLNSFKAVKDSLTFEIKRQAEILGRGEKIIQETRLWDAKELKTVSMRSKEEAKDYRYFPEPDLTPFLITKEKIDKIRTTIPELPKEKALRLIREYGLTEYDAGILVLDRKDADYAENCLMSYAPADKKPIANWLIGPLLSEAHSLNCGICETGVSPAHLIELISFVEKQQISHLTAKSVLSEMVKSKKTASLIIKEKDLIQISDTESLQGIIEEILNANQKSVQDYKAGKENACMFLVGQVMKKTGSRANPKVVGELLKRRLSDA
ncbi:MAG: Asp-tRNA(Asn)/Glu-tRNA(Gln) amidotransferase subunit GatB [Candidatus Omnitrophota bacterium]|jgi:aspartyl-tRNA(Asn)/glutamyl-tRNA(Gln) amidotransferase subunit B